ncbi:MAG TPA: hypothetical protein VLT61_11250 [Anaeromyxobacteraceae bacterium]|nr:hypothetical protein [Anaeromyxobacteraceae bacterium]
MILLEFAAQGIRGVAPTGGRATLRPGYNVVAADGAVLRRLLDALLFPDGKDAEPLPRAPGGPANAPLRAGLTLLGDDRITYRLVRDFGGAAQLHRFDAEKRSFALVAQDLAEISGVLRSAGGAPDRERFAALLCLAAADLPSKQGGALAASGPSGPARAALSPAQLQKKIADLKGELVKARASEKLQFQQDGLQARAFKLDEALKEGAKLQEGLDRAQEELKALEPVAAVLERLGDADAKIGAFEKVASRREEALARVAAERETIDAAEAAGGPPAFWTERDFLIGAGAGGAALAFGIVGAVGGAATRYLALLSIPALGWAAWVAFGWVARLEAWGRIARKRRVIDDWERKMLDQFERDAADIRGAMQELGVDKVQDLRDLAGRLEDGESVTAEWRRRIGEWRADPEIANAQAERAKLSRELKAVEDRLQAEIGGGFVRDVRSIEAEIQRLEGELANPAPAQPAPVAAALAKPAGDPLRLLLEGAAKALGGSPAAAVRGIQQKASQTLSGITFQRIAGVSADDRGNVQAQTGGRLVPAATLTAADRDLLFIALKLGFMEVALAQGKAVAYVDDCFGGLSDGARRLVARLLKQMARPGQIVHATSDGSFKEAADHSA